MPPAASTHCVQALTPGTMQAEQQNSTVTSGRARRHIRYFSEHGSASAAGGLVLSETHGWLRGAAFKWRKGSYSVSSSPGLHALHIVF